MKLSQLVKDLPIERHGDVAVTGLCSHSGKVAPGNLFIAKRGGSVDGADYIEQAVTSGAAAVLTDLYNPFLEVAQLVTPNVSAVEAELAARFYHDPSKELFTVGITGTNGKTTTSYLIKHLFDQLGLPCGMIGTIEYVVGDQHFTADLTTPEVTTNQKLLREMARRGGKAAVMEVSSIGIEQGRVDQIDYDVAIFTNLSEDHLDFHGTMEAYGAAKAKFFTAATKYALFNADSKWTPLMRENCTAEQLTYGFSQGADLCAHTVEGASFQVTYQRETQTFTSPLLGEFNIYNQLAAIGAALLQGASFAALPEVLATFAGVPGRLEKVGSNTYVDYAHTPDALEKALRTLRETSPKRLITVFGCGGDRDQEKRPLMGAVAQNHSDYSIVTSDNPRTEDPLNICEQITSAMRSNFTIETDRRAAITKAIAMATPDDIVLIAGKGHETYQICGHQTHPFDDRQVAQEVMQ